MVKIFLAGEFPPPTKKLKKSKRVVSNKGFHDSMKHLMFISQFFALFPLNGVLNSHYKDMNFTWCSFRTFYTLFITVAALIEGLWCVYFLTQMEGHFQIYELNVVMFYCRGTLTCLVFLRLAKNWKELMKEFDIIETLLRSYPSSKFLHTKLKLISIGIFFAATVEHMTAQINNMIKSVRCENNLHDIFHRFFAYISYRQIFIYIPYNFYIGLCLQLLNLFITFGWTFIDVFIVYASLNFSEKLVQLNKQISLTIEKRMASPTTWRTMRENYTRLLHLFTKLNEEMNDIILVSFMSNIFFLLTQIYSWMRLNVVYDVALTHIYFVFTTTLLISRTAFVCFYGASIGEESYNLMNNLVTTPTSLYNEEVERFIVQVYSSPMILSGSNFFLITRSLILKIAGSIVTYELVMIQFTNKNSNNEQGPPC